MKKLIALSILSLMISPLMGMESIKPTVQECSPSVSRDPFAYIKQIPAHMFIELKSSGVINPKSVRVELTAQCNGKSHVIKVRPEIFDKGEDSLLYMSQNDIVEAISADANITNQQMHTDTPYPCTLSSIQLLQSTGGDTVSYTFRFQSSSTTFPMYGTLGGNIIGEASPREVSSKLFNAGSNRYSYLRSNTSTADEQHPVTLSFAVVERGEAKDPIHNTGNANVYRSDSNKNACIFSLPEAYKEFLQSSELSNYIGKKRVYPTVALTSLTFGDLSIRPPLVGDNQFIRLQPFHEKNTSIKGQASNVSVSKAVS